MSGMSIIKPTPITDAVLVSSTAPETDQAPWALATPYGIGGLCMSPVTHRIYKSLRATNTGNDPTVDANRAGATPWWLDIGPTNRWAAFDRKVGTATTVVSPLVNVFRPGSASGVAMLELVGRQVDVTYTDAPGGAVVYSKTISLDGSIIESFYDWFFVDYEQLTDFALTDLPAHFPNGQLTISLSSTGTVSCGVQQIGQVIEIGETQYGATVGIIDWSGKEVDEFGNVDVVERGYSKRINMKIITKKSDFNKIYRRLAGLRATPCVYIGVGEAGFEPMISYAFYKDFSIDVAYATEHLCNIEIEGLTT